MNVMRSALLLLLLPSLAWGGEPIDKEQLVAELTRRIDAEWQAQLDAEGVKPSGRADDAEYLRRVMLDLVGRIPTVWETRTFLADASKNKRSAKVRELMRTAAYALHISRVMRAEWLPQTLDADYNNSGKRFQDWLEQELAHNRPIDSLVHAILIQPTGEERSVKYGMMDQPKTDTADGKVGILGFYDANENKPELLAAAATRVFLGVKLECAQCHDHPFADYTQEEFWEQAAFFSEFAPLPPTSPSFVGPLPAQHEINRISIPDSDTLVVARRLRGAMPEWSSERTPRVELADWITSRDNPYFHENMANRAWKHFFGVGIVDPVDERSFENPPSHPKLLHAMAKTFRESGCDIQVLYRAITASAPYNRTSRSAVEADAQLFAVMPVRGLTGHQIYDSFLAATGQSDNVNPQDTRNYYYGGSFRREFVEQFGAAQAEPTRTQSSILQALTMMNGNAVGKQTSLKQSRTLAAVADAPFLDTEGKIEAIFLATLSRKPTPQELQRFESYIARGGPTNDPKQALADVFWIMLNTTEFMTNR